MYFSLFFRCTILVIYVFYMVILWKKTKLFDNCCQRLSKRRRLSNVGQFLTLTRKMRRTLAEVRSSKFVLAILRYKQPNRELSFVNNTSPPPLLLPPRSFLSLSNDNNAFYLSLDSWDISKRNKEMSLELVGAHFANFRDSHSEWISQKEFCWL